MTTNKRVLLFLLILTLLVGGFMLWAFYALKEEAGAFSDAAENYNHSVCQYPERTTNPTNGCDNSDPCDPENAAKGGSGDCGDAICPSVGYAECIQKLCDNGAGRCEDKNAVDLPDPSRNYFDAEGNEFDADGNLVKPWQGQPLEDGGK